MADETKSLAIQKAPTREPVPFSPRNFDDGWRQAQALARSTLVPKGLRGANLEETTANVMVALMWGNEVGVSPVQSMFSINVIHGRPSMAAALKVGLVKQAPECLYFQCIETTAQQATWETHRKGNPKPSRLTFTAAQAQRAGLLNRDTRSGQDDNWTKWTETMLRWRAGAMLADAEYPDVTRGLGTQDERPPEDAEPVSAIPETRPVVEVLPPAEATRKHAAENLATLPRISADEAKTATADEYPRGARVDPPEVTDPDVTRDENVPREPGSDDGDEPDPMEQEANAILSGLNAEDVTREALDALVKRLTALGLPPGDPLRVRLEAAYKAAQKRIKARG